MNRLRRIVDFLTDFLTSDCCMAPISSAVIILLGIAAMWLLAVAPDALDSPNDRPSSNCRVELHGTATCVVCPRLFATSVTCNWAERSPSR